MLKYGFLPAAEVTYSILWAKTAWQKITSNLIYTKLVRITGVHYSIGATLPDDARLVALSG